MRLHRATGVILAVALVGCVSGEAPEARPGDQPNGPRPVVIALVDSGVNPYYEVFEGEAILPDVGFDVGTIVLSRRGSTEERVAQDQAAWDSVEIGRLYHFPGTRLLGITFTDRETPGILDTSAHGAAVNYLSAISAPEVIIVSVQVWQGPCPTLNYCLWDPSIADAMEWVAAQPWIDVVSSSMGYPGNPPEPSAASSVVSRWVRATEAAARSGKLVLSSAGNYPSTPLPNTMAGPPWVIAVGGSHSESGGEHAYSARGVDVVADYSVEAPSSGLDNSTHTYHGTSFATPVVAGTLAQALSIMRDAGREASYEQMRSALNASALLIGPADWRPSRIVQDPEELAARASLPILTQAQMGWGYVNSSLAPEIARRVLEGDLAPPAEKDQAILVQAQYQRAREEYWANWPR